MNAYEPSVWKMSVDEVKALIETNRQQADRISELEKESANLENSLKNALIFIDNAKKSKPVAWTEKDLMNACRNARLTEDDFLRIKAYLPLYTHPVKQLSDEEIEFIVKEWFNCHPEESLTSKFAMPLYSVVNLYKQLLRRLQND